MIKKCLYCEKEFESDNMQKTHCSPSCAHKNYHRRTYAYAPIGKKFIKCKQCGKEFEVNMSGKVSVYCSRSCKNKFKHAKKNPTGTGSCIQCGKEIVLHFNKNGETKNKFCSQLCGERYRYKINLEKTRIEANKPHRRYNVYRLCAKQRNIKFNLSPDEFKTFWNNRCYYCHDKIDGIGIDRVNNNIGYETDNCVPCCETCNRMKLTMTKEKFIEMCTKVAQIHSHNTSKENN
jgi:hypothetical protein